ncbi:MAG TPA: hypothetical protein PK228_09385, partial [Saprospiraceae bacterium]|nr:hypothetical protein [Saprospiraceae bacterium]
AEQTVQYTHNTKVVTLKPALYSWQKIAVAASVAILLSAGAWWWLSSENLVSEQIVQQTPVQQEQPEATQEKPMEQTAVAGNNSVEPSKSQAIEKNKIRKHKKPAIVQPDPETEQAMEEIKAALALVSSKIRRGKQEASKGAIHLETVDKVFKKKTEG